MRDKSEGAISSDVARDHCLLYLLLNAASGVAMFGQFFGFVWLPQYGGVWVIAGITSFFLDGLCWGKITVRFLNLGIEMRLMGIDCSLSNILLRGLGVRQGGLNGKANSSEAPEEAVHAHSG